MHVVLDAAYNDGLAVEVAEDAAQDQDVERKRLELRRFSPGRDYAVLAGLAQPISPVGRLCRRNVGCKMWFVTHVTGFVNL